MIDLTLPKKINPCPIVEAVLEIRFNSSFPADAVYGVLFLPLKQIFNSEIEKLPILQIPELIRNQDPSFKYKPYYRMVKDDIVFQFAPDLISIININSYLGWDVFSQKINEILNKVIELNVIDKIERIALRYIDFFDTDIIDKINLSININNDVLESKETFLRTKIESEKFEKILQVSNSAMNIRNSVSVNGSTLDIDVSLKDYTNISNENLYSSISELHKEEKVTFFKLLKEDFLNTLNPEYLEK